MKILFIRPKPSPDTIGLQHLMVVEPLELEVMAALTGQEDDVQIVDMILEEKPVADFIQAFQPDVFCTTGYITHIPEMIKYCVLAKKLIPGVVTVVGGVHIEKFPEDIDHPAVDYRVVRNATLTFPGLLDHLKNGAPLPLGVLKTGEQMDESKLLDYDFSFPYPNRRLTQKYRDRYFYVFHNRVALLKTSFGCPHKCNFCFCRKITGDHYFARPLEDVINELKSIDEKEIYIIDDDFLLSAPRLRKFMELLKSNNIRKKYLVYGRADFIVDHPDLIREFKAMGLRTVIVGLESFNDTELEQFEKHTTRKINEDAMRILRKNKVDCYAAVIISPDWDKNDFQKAGDKLLALGIKFVNLQPLTPLKGTGIEVPDNKLIVPRSDYPRWDLAHVIIRPTKMTVPEFYQQLLNLYERVVFRPGYLIDHLLHQPWSMQWKMAKGMSKVHRQYRQRIQENTFYAEDTIHTSDSIQ